MADDYNFLAKGIGPALAEGSHAAYFGAHARQLNDQAEGSKAAAPFMADALAGDKDAIRQVALTAPQFLQHIAPRLAAMDAQRQAHVQKVANWAGDTAGAILAAPEAEREGLYASAKAAAEAQGIPTTAWPAGYDPNWLTVQRSHATHIRQWVPPVKAPKAGGGGGGAAAGDGHVDLSDAGPPGVSPSGTMMADAAPATAPAMLATPQAAPPPGPSGPPPVMAAEAAPIGGAAPPNATGEGGGEALSSGTSGDETSAPFAPPVQMAQASPPQLPGAGLAPPAAGLQTPTPEGLPPRPVGTHWGSVDPVLYGGKPQGSRLTPKHPVMPDHVNGEFLYRLPPDAAHPQGEIVMFKPPSTAPEGDKWVDELGPDGKTIIGQRNGKTNQYHPINAKPPTSADIPPEMADVHGPEFIDFLKGRSPEKANIVRSVIDQKPGFLPSDLSKRSDFNNLMGLVLQAQPDYDPTGPGQRRQFEMNLAKSNDANAVTLSAANTAISHARIFRDLTEAMRNGDTRMVNMIVNEAKKQFGDANVPSAEIARDLYGEELVKAVKGGGPPNEKQEQQMRANLSINAGPKAMQGVIDTVTNLMEGRVHTVEDTARKFGVPESRIKEYISPRSRETLDYIKNNPLGAPKESAAPINPVAVDRLKANPGTAAQFDEVFGKGAAAKVLGK